MLRVDGVALVRARRTGTRVRLVARMEYSQSLSFYWSRAWNILSRCRFIGRPCGIFQVKTFVRAHDLDHGINLEKVGATAVVPEMLEPSLQLAAAALFQLGFSSEEVTTRSVEVLGREALGLRAADLSCLG
eukprot:7192321-Pyramimonas_sp.AAC.1